MTLDQGFAFAILVGMVALFIWDRLRYDVVAVLALLIAIAAGIVPSDNAFTGFSDQIVIIVASALVVSAAIGRSGVVESLVAPLVPVMTTTSAQIAILVSIVTVLSAFMKNIGALAIFIPIAVQIARKTELPPSRLLMPLAFGSLLGGLMTLIGTSPNIIVSRMRAELVGAPFGMFDFLPVGAGIAAVGVLFLVFGWRLLPRTGRGRPAPENLFKIEDYLSEAQILPGSPIIGKTVAEFEAMSDGDVTVAAIIREQFRRYVPAGNWTLFEGDVLVLESDPHALQKIVDKAKLELVGTKDVTPEQTRKEELATVEAVVTGESALIGRTAADLHLRERFQVNLLAVSRNNRRMATRLRRLRFQPGDVIVLQGAEVVMPDALADLGCLPLAERNVQLGQRRRSLLPVVILAVAMGLVTTDLVPVTVGFFGAAVLMVVVRAVTLKEAYQSIDWPIIVLLGALIPVSDAFRTTGASELVAAWLADIGSLLSPMAALAMIMIAAMLVTPFLNNAATVLVMAPVAAGLAQRLGLSIDAFLMAVAVGAACDFLTPIGHQCNTLVMGPGGYRFGDYWRLGLPLSTIVVVVGVPLIMLVWAG